MMKKRGFTLIELLVVVSIIALLISILLPALSKAREQAKRAVCVIRLKGLTTAWHLYAMNNNGALCQPSNRVIDREQYGWIRGSIAQQDQETTIKNGTLWPYAQDLEVYRCPTGMPGEKITYAMFHAMGSTMKPADWPVCFTMGQIKRPSGRSVFIDEGAISVDGYDTVYTRPAWWDLPLVRHSNGETLSFADTHAEYWKWVDELTLLYAQGIGTALQPHNPDLERLQRVNWGQLGYNPNDTKTWK
jgi:prepilin-type N-terminal cleavage/methylation domain-containing protein